MFPFGRYSCLAGRDQHGQSRALGARSGRRGSRAPSPSRFSRSFRGAPKMKPALARKKVCGRNSGATHAAALGGPRGNLPRPGQAVCTADGPAPSRFRRCEQLLVAKATAATGLKVALSGAGRGRTFWRLFPSFEACPKLVRSALGTAYTGLRKILSGSSPRRYPTA